MFEFIEDKKVLRPKYIGTIKNNAIRKIMIALMVIPTIFACILLNIFAFSFHVIFAFWKLILFGTFKIFASLLKEETWESWSKPRSAKNIRQVQDDLK